MDCFILFNSGHRISAHLSKYLKTYLLNKIKKEIEKDQLNRWIDILIIKKKLLGQQFLILYLKIKLSNIYILQKYMCLYFLYYKIKNV